MEYDGQGSEKSEKEMNEDEDEGEEDIRWVSNLLRFESEFIILESLELLLLCSTQDSESFRNIKVQVIRIFYTEMSTGLNEKSKVHLFHFFPHY